MSSAAQIWAHRPLIVNLARRDVAAKYKKSLLGRLWSLINPAATLGVYTLVFGVFLSVQAPVAGNGHTRVFALYLFVALVVWNCFSNTVLGGMNALEGAAPLLTKVYFPPECPALAAVIGVFIQTVTELAILFGIMVVVGNLSPWALITPLLIVAVQAFALGLGLVLSVANIRYRDVGYLVGIGLQVLFYCTPIVYPASSIPEQKFGLPLRTIFGLNPTYRFVEAMRDVAYHLRLPSVGTLVYIAVVPTVVLVLAWLWFSRSAPQVIEEL